MPEEARGEKAPGLSLEELRAFYEKLSPEQCDELLQGLLIVAPRGEEAMIKVLEDELLCHATEELIEDGPGPVGKE